MAISYALKVPFDWEGDKAVAVDVDVIAGRKSDRFFFPRSQLTNSDSGVTYVPQWLIEAKRGEAVAKGYDFTDINKGLSDVFDWKDQIGEKDKAPAQDHVMVVRELLEAFDRAAERIKYPKLKIDAGGYEVRIARQGDRSKNAGGLRIDNGRRYGDPQGHYYGHVDRFGAWHIRSRTPADVIEAVAKLASNLADNAGFYGRESGNCCFCSRDLEDPRSVRVGYGPVCADNYGLPWGNSEPADEA